MGSYGSDCACPQCNSGSYWTSVGNSKQWSWAIRSLSPNDGTCDNWRRIHFPKRWWWFHPLQFFRILTMGIEEIFLKPLSSMKRARVLVQRALHNIFPRNRKNQTAFRESILHLLFVWTTILTCSYYRSSCCDFLPCLLCGRYGKSR